MTDLEDRLRTMLSQAQAFARFAPMEAVARARLAAREAKNALASADPETQRWLRPLAAYAERAVAQHEETLARWQADNRAREQRFLENERERYNAPVPGLSGRAVLPG